MIPAHMLTLDAELTYREAGTPDDYNQPTTGSPTTITVKGYLRPLRTNTVVTDGLTVSTDASLIVNPLARVDGLGPVIVDGQRYSIDGEPVAHFNPTTRQLVYHQLYLRREVS